MPKKSLNLKKFMSSQWLISEIPTKEEMKNLFQEVQQVSKFATNMSFPIRTFGLALMTQPLQLQCDEFFGHAEVVRSFSC